jgi:adenylate cyclase
LSGCPKSDLIRSTQAKGAKTDVARGVIHLLSDGDRRADPRDATTERTLYAVAHFDMVGYSRLIGLDDIGTVERLRVLRRDFIDPRLQRHGGRLVQIAGDSLLVVFESVVNAVRCAVEVQRSVPAHNENQPDDRRILFRIGIEIGDIIVDGDDHHGDGLNVAARLQAECPPGGICISRAVHDHVKNRLDVAFEEVGLLSLKNIARPIDALVVRLTPAAPGDQVETASPGRGMVQPRLHARPSDGPPRIAVLPFQQFDDDPTPTHVTNGLVADIVYQLAGLRELNVISLGSTIGIREADSNLREIGHRLGARYLVRGGLQRVGAMTRLTAELTEAESGEVLWTRRSDMDNPLSFDVQDRVVARIVNTLAPRVHDNELRRIRGMRPEDLSVYDKILLAREHIMMLERDGFTEAMGLLDDAIAQEPEYAEAYALAAELHVLLIGQGWSPDRTFEAGEIDQLTRKALMLDRDNVRALVCNGHRKSLLHRDYPAALEMFRHALDIAPNSAHVWQRSSFTFAYIGDGAEAIRRAERAVELSPFDREPYWYFSALCVAHYTAGNFDAAAEWGLRALGEKTMLRSTAGWAAASLAAIGRMDDAREVAAQTMVQWPERRVENIVAQHPYRDKERRESYGQHLLAAGFP